MAAEARAGIAEAWAADEAEGRRRDQDQADRLVDLLEDEIKARRRRAAELEGR